MSMSVCPSAARWKVKTKENLQKAKLLILGNHIHKHEYKVPWIKGDSCWWNLTAYYIPKYSAGWKVKKKNKRNET